MWQFFYFSHNSHNSNCIYTIAGYGGMGSNPTALWQSEPAYPNGSARRIPKHWMCSHTSAFTYYFSKAKIEANMLAMGFAP